MDSVDDEIRLLGVDEVSARRRDHLPSIVDKRGKGLLERWVQREGRSRISPCVPGLNHRDADNSKDGLATEETWVLGGGSAHDVGVPAPGVAT